MYLCKCGKSYSKQSSLRSHARFCKQYEKTNKVSKYKIDERYVCECGRSFEKHQSLNAHFSYCKIHRNGKSITRSLPGYCGWNKGLTKDTSNIILKISKSVSKTNTGRRLSDDWKKHLSDSLKGKTGGVRENSNKWRGCHIEMNGKIIWLDSSYEKRLVCLLNKFEIPWVKNRDKFPYIYEKCQYSYIPDFYLPELNLWIEVKGWIKDKDLAKWKNFPHRLIVIKLKALERLEKIESKHAIMAELAYAQDRGSWSEMT